MTAQVSIVLEAVAAALVIPANALGKKSASGMHTVRGSRPQHERHDSG
jgi:hypothetical protein